MKKFRELKRQAFHILLGLVLVVLGLLFGKQILVAASLFLLVIALVASHLVSRGYQHAFSDFALFHFDRYEVLPFKGAITYLIGILFAATLIRDYQLALAVIAILAVGDGFSTLVGYFLGKHKLPFNEKKSFEGLFAFIISSTIVASFLVSMNAAILYSVALGLVEAFDSQIDDNLSIPGAAWLLNFII